MVLRMLAQSSLVMPWSPTRSHLLNSIFGELGSILRVERLDGGIAFDFDLALVLADLVFDGVDFRIQRVHLAGDRGVPLSPALSSMSVRASVALAARRPEGLDRFLRVLSKKNRAAAA